MKLTNKQDKIFNKYFNYIKECQKGNTINNIDVEGLLTRLYNDLQE